VRTTRVYCAGVVLGATLAAAVWLYTYRVWDTVEYIDRTGYHFRPSEHVRTTPGWSVYATVALIFTGAAVSLWLLPGHRRLIQRFAARFVKPSRELRRPR
jgi:hypothetical protein